MCASTRSAHCRSRRVPIWSTAALNAAATMRLTPTRLHTHNLGVRALLRRALVALALAPCLVLVPVMPQQHVHDADEAHAHAVAHSHVDFHQHADGHRPSAADHAAPEVSADDERAVWVTSTSLNQRAFQLSPTWALLDESFAGTLKAPSTTRQPDIDSSPPHGPPRPSFSLRGPPPASA